MAAGQARLNCLSLRWRLEAEIEDLLESIMKKVAEGLLMSILRQNTPRREVSSSLCMYALSWFQIKDRLCRKFSHAPYPVRAGHTECAGPVIRKDTSDPPTQSEEEKYPSCLTLSYGHVREPEAVSFKREHQILWVGAASFSF